MSPSASKPNPRNSKKSANIWRNIGPAGPQSNPLSSHSIASQVYLHKLDLTAEQNEKIQHLYNNSRTEDSTYLPESESEQIVATALLATYHLDFDARASLASRWSIKWAVFSGATGNKQNRRVLYQW